MMKTLITAISCIGIFFTGVLFADENPFLRHPVESDVVWFDTVASKMRDNYLTNVFYSLTTNGFVMIKISERNVTLGSKLMNNEDVFVQNANYLVEDSNICFEVGYYTTTNKIDGGRLALAHATAGYSSMMPPWFKQYMDGPGNCCLVFKTDNVNEPTKILDIFFCRDNVAVRVRNSFSGDVFAFAHLLDECILTSFAEKNIVVKNQELLLETISALVPTQTGATASLLTTNVSHSKTTELKINGWQIPLLDDKPLAVENGSPPHGTIITSYSLWYAVFGILLALGICVLALRKRKNNS